MRLFFLLLAATLPVAAEPADWILTGRYVVTMDPQRRIIENGAVAVQGERIAAVGPRADVERDWSAKQRIANPNSILLPGLLNTHTHAPMSLFRGIADDMRLQEWLEKFIFPAEAKNVDPEFVRWGTRLACLEMLLSGTTTYTDMYYFEEIVAEETRAAGMRGVLGQTIIKFPAPDAPEASAGLARAEAFVKKFKGDTLIVPAVAPHAIFTNDDQTLKAARALADKYSVPLLIHLSETKKENDDTKRARGKTPMQALDELGFFSGRTLAAHGVWLDDADIATLVKRGVGVAHCPSSNMKLASGIAPVTKLLAAGAAVGLGPDGPAGSNNDFNLFEEIDLAAKLQKVATGDPAALNAKQAIEMATILGARALGMEREIGSIERGKRADVIAVSLDSPRAMPMYDVYSHLAYVLKGSDVRHVMVNGRVLVRDRMALTLDAAGIQKKAVEYGSSIRAGIAGE